MEVLAILVILSGQAVGDQIIKFVFSSKTEAIPKLYNACVIRHDVCSRGPPTLQYIATIYRYTISCYPAHYITSECK